MLQAKRRPPHSPPRTLAPPIGIGGSLAAPPFNPSPPSGWIEDWRLQAVDHARHTKKKRFRLSTEPLVKIVQEYGRGRFFPSDALGWNESDAAPASSQRAARAGRPLKKEGYGVTR